MLLSHKGRKNETMPFAAVSVDLEIIILSEISQIGNDKYHMMSLICEILTNDKNELTCKTNYLKGNDRAFSQSKTYHL